MTTPKNLIKDPLCTGLNGSRELVSDPGYIYKNFVKFIYVFFILLQRYFLSFYVEFISEKSNFATDKSINNTFQNTFRKHVYYWKCPAQHYMYM